MYRFKLLLLCFLLFFWTPDSFPAEDAAADFSSKQMEQLENIQKKYQGLTSLSFNFQQTVLSSGRKRHGAGNGIFYRSSPEKPSIIRWNYTDPDPQIILNDGVTLSIYTKKDKQVIIASAGDMESDITYSFFAGKRNLSDDFKMLAADKRFAPANDKQENIFAVQLVPKEPHGQIKAVHLWFAEHSVIRKLVMEDHFDTVTELVFSKVRFDDLPADSEEIVKEIVKLDLPPDTEIIKQ